MQGEIGLMHRFAAEEMGGGIVDSELEGLGDAGGEVEGGGFGHWVGGNQYFRFINNRWIIDRGCSDRYGLADSVA